MNLLKDLKNLGSHDKGTTDNWFITVERAEGVEDKDRWSKVDTYVIAEFGGQKVRTHTINNSRTPFWNETFNLKVQSDHVKDLHIKLMDDDLGTDDAVGIAVISKEDLPLNSGDERYLRVPVFRKEQITGIIVLRIKKFNESYQQQQPVQSSQQHTSSSFQQPYITQPQNVSSVNYQQQPQSQQYSQQIPQQPQSQQYSQQIPQQPQSQQYSQQMPQQPIYSEKQPAYYDKHRHQ